MKTLATRLILWGLVSSMGIVVSCRKENGVDYRKSPYYFYSQDSSRILYDTNRGLASILSKAEYKDVTDDATHFEVISKDFGKDARHIYYTFFALKNVDYNSFFWDEENELPKDKRHVYYPTTSTENLKVVKHADPQTYERVKLEHPCLRWYRDKRYYFYDHERTDADREALSFESPLLPHDQKYVYSVDNGKVNRKAYTGTIVFINVNMLRDDHTYYFKAHCDSTRQYIKYADGQTFRYYNQEKQIFGVDSCIYIMGILLESDHLDVASFEVLDYDYCKDKGHVYYKHRHIPDADPVTFTILSDRFAKDKKNVYEYGTIMSGYKPREFKQDNWGRFPTDRDYGKSPKRRYKSDDDD